MGTKALTLDDFTPLVGETFTADFGADGTLELVLIETEELPTGSGSVTAFVAVFRGPLDRVFQQATVDLANEAFGRYDVFLVAVGEDEQGRTYEATFSRIAS